MLTICVLGFCLFVWQMEVSEAAPIGTAFTYQGRLNDADRPADGQYDFEFKLFDDPDTQRQQGTTNAIDGLKVSDGNFTVLLDFGSDVFNSDARWLEIAVRPYRSLGHFTILSPRQEITPVPYTLGVRVPLKLEGAIDDTSAIEARNSVSYPSSTWLTSSFEAAHASDFFSFGVKGSDIVTGPPPSTPWRVGYGGYFTSEGVLGSDCGGEVPFCTEAHGVYGRATGADESYGGYFEGDSCAVWGQNGQFENCGALGYGAAYGVYGSNWVATAEATGVYGKAEYNGDLTNYGGYFKADGSTGRGVYGEASNSGSYENYGGYFTASGEQGRGVYGEASHDGYLTANYGGHFVAKGGYGIGVYGAATHGPIGNGASINYGGYFEAAGDPGTGVYAEGSTYGVYGKSNAPGGYAGYFQGRVAATKGVEMPIKYYEVESTGIDPNTVTTEIHTFCALTKFKFRTAGATTTDRWAELVRNPNGTWTLIVRAPIEGTIIAGCQCF